MLEQSVTPIIVALLGGAFGMITGLGGAYYLFKGKKLDKVHERLEHIEAKEEACRNELNRTREDVFELREELQGLYLITDIMIVTYPDVDQKVKEARTRLIGRRQQRAIERREEQQEQAKEKKTF